MRNSRALRLKFDKPSYNEDVRAVEVDTPGMGKGVQAATDIPPASYICDYKGDILTSYKAVQKLLREGNNKLLQIGNKQLWIDGQSPLNTLGSKFNHACNCVANCEFVIENDKAYVYTKASTSGGVKTGDSLTIDYGYGKDLTKAILKDKHLQWYVDYLSVHECKRLEVPMKL